MATNSRLDIKELMKMKELCGQMETQVASNELLSGLLDLSLSILKRQDAPVSTDAQAKTGKKTGNMNKAIKKKVPSRRGGGKEKGKGKGGTTLYNLFRQDESARLKEAGAPMPFGELQTHCSALWKMAKESAKLEYRRRAEIINAERSAAREEAAAQAQREQGQLASSSDDNSSENDDDDVY